MPCVMVLIGIFALVLIVSAVSLILEGLESGDRSKVIKGAGLGLGTAIGTGIALKHLSDKEKEKQRQQLNAAENSATDVQRR